LRREIVVNGMLAPTVAEATKLANLNYGTKLQDGTIKNIISQDSCRRAFKNPNPPLKGRPKLLRAPPDVVMQLPRPRKELRKSAGAFAPLQRDEQHDIDACVLPEQQRCAIFVIFVQVLDAPPESEWYGTNGTISIIMKILHMAPGSRDVVDRVLKEASRCIDEGISYSPGRKFTADEDSRALIKRGSVEEQIVADCIEDGQSYAIACDYVNDYRAKKQLPHIGISAVATWCERMHDAGFSKTSRISKMKQGMLFLSLLSIFEYRYIS
jgi:hypothetical protein